MNERARERNNGNHTHYTPRLAQICASRLHQMCGIGWKIRNGNKRLIELQQVYTMFLVFSVQTIMNFTLSLPPPLPSFNRKLIRYRHGYPLFRMKLRALRRSVDARFLYCRTTTRERMLVGYGMPSPTAKKYFGFEWIVIIWLDTAWLLCSYYCRCCCFIKHTLDRKTLAKESWNADKVART